jgi:hypothetical protein
MRSRQITVAVALTAGLVIGPMPSRAEEAADPVGTVTLSERNEPSTIMVRGASEAGLLYATDSAVLGASQWWLKAPGAGAVKVSWQPGWAALEGRMLFDFTGPLMRYSLWDGPVLSCPISPSRTERFLPTGWAFLDRADGAVKVVDATASGCTTRTFLASTAEVQPVEVFAGDAGGLVILVRHADGSTTLGYHPNGDPTHPILLDMPGSGVGDPHSRATVRGGAILLVSNTGPDGASRTWRIPVDGSTSTELPAGPDEDGGDSGGWTATTATGAARVGADGLSIVSSTGGPVHVLAGVTGQVASDGTAFYTTQAPGDPPGIYARRAVPGDPVLVVPLPDTMYPSVQYGIALSPGRVYYTSWNPPAPYNSTYDVRMRTLSTGPGTVTVGPEQTVGTPAGFAALSASAGRLVYDGNKQRTYTASILTMNTIPAAPPEASGNRWLIRWDKTSGMSSTSGRSMYDVRTGRTASVTSWPQGAQDLFGNYLLYARSDGAVRLRNLLTGTETQPRAAGSPMAAVALHSRWAAWVTGCRAGDNTCAQTLTVRDLSTGATRNYGTRHTTSLDLSGGYLGFDATWTTTRVLRTVRLDNGAIAVIGRLPANSFDPYDELALTPPRHFDVEDEVIGWLDENHYGKVAHLASFIDPPRYLGNVIAPASFKTTWSIALPVSKALPSCTVTIYRGTTKVRILNCANTTGMVAVTWNGRTATGAILPTGTYTYRVSGRDEDNYWLRNYDGRLTTIGGTITKTN